MGSRIKRNKMAGKVAREESARGVDRFIREIIQKEQEAKCHKEIAYDRKKAKASIKKLKSTYESSPITKSDNALCKGYGFSSGAKAKFLGYEGGVKTTYIFCRLPKGVRSGIQKKEEIQCPR